MVMFKNNVLVLIVCFLLVGCGTSESNKKIPQLNSGSKSGMDNSQNALDWAGNYEGTLPCADCPGIITVLNLKSDNSFSMYNKYIDRDVEINDTGSFTWDDKGSVVHLKGKNTDVKYKVGEGVLIQLDLEGNLIEGPLKDAFNLKKHDIAH